MHLVARVHVADVVRTHAAVDLGVGEAGAGLVGLVLADLAVGVLEGPLLLLHLDDALDAEGDRLGVLAIADRRRADRIEADLGRYLALLVGAGRDDTDGLPLDVRRLRAEQVPRDLLAVQLLDDLHALLLHSGRAARDRGGAHGDRRRAQPHRGRDPRERARLRRGGPAGPQARRRLGRH